MKKDVFVTTIIVRGNPHFILLLKKIICNLKLVLKLHAHVMLYLGIQNLKFIKFFTIRKFPKFILTDLKPGEHIAVQIVIFNQDVLPIVLIAHGQQVLQIQPLIQLQLPV